MLRFVACLNIWTQNKWNYFEYPTYLYEPTQTSYFQNKTLTAKRWNCRFFFPLSLEVGPIMSAILPNECAPTKLSDAVGKVKDHMNQILLSNWMMFVTFSLYDIVWWDNPY